MKMGRFDLNKEQPVRLAVFASGNGSNFERIVKAARSGIIDAEVCLLVCDRPKAFVIKRAEALGVPSVAFQPKSFDSKLAYELEVLDQLKTAQIDLVILAGYMRIVGNTLLKAFPDKLMNIHPSLLPHYPGRQGIKDAFEDGAKETGVTVHIVDEGIDTGPILAQEAVAIEPADTIESLERKIHALEHDLFPKVIQTYIKKLQKEHA